MANRLLIVAPDFHPRNGGYANACTAFALTLAATDTVEVEVLTPIPVRSPEEGTLPSIRIHRTSSQRPGVADIRLWRRASALDNERRFDFVLFETADYPIAGLLALATFGRDRVAVRVHAVAETEWTLYRWHPWYLFRRLPAILFFRRVRFVLSTSRYYLEFVRDKFLAANPLLIADKRFDVIPNIVSERGPVEDDAPARHTQVARALEARVSFLSVGRLDAESERQKNFGRLLAALAILRDTHGHDDYALVLVGRGDYVPRLKEQCRALELESQVVFVDALPRDELRRLQRSVSAAVLASTFDGMAMFALESLEAGAALLLSDTGGLRELVEHGENGLLFDPLDPRDIARKLDRFIRELHPELDAVRKASRDRYAAQFAPDDTATRFLQDLVLFRSEPTRGSG
jgi:glycosyltransferase involved in cell wall biosynthesis